MVECTLSLHWQLPPTKSPTSYYLFHDLVRTCRISSFCTVGWQLARFQLTRRIARSLGDNWASCPAWLWPGTCLCLVACVAILYGRQAFEGRLDWNLQYSHWQRTGSYERFFQLLSNWLQLEETQIHMLATTRSRLEVRCNFFRQRVATPWNHCQKLLLKHLYYRHLQKEIWCAEERVIIKPTASMPGNLPVTSYKVLWISSKYVNSIAVCFTLL